MAVSIRRISSSFPPSTPVSMSCGKVSATKTISTHSPSPSPQTPFRTLDQRSCSRPLVLKPTGVPLQTPRLELAPDCAESHISLVRRSCIRVLVYTAVVDKAVESHGYGNLQLFGGDTILVMCVISAYLIPLYIYISSEEEL